jgi:hypothetical protein
MSGYISDRYAILMTLLIVSLYKIKEPFYRLAMLTIQRYIMPESSGV